MMNSTKIRVITNIITMVILVSFIVYLIISWNNIPDKVITHFDAMGEANAYGKKNNIILIPLVAVIICTILAVIECFPQFWNFPVKVTVLNRDKLINDGLIMIGILKIIIAILFCYIGVCTAKSMSLSWFMYVLLVAIAIDIIVGIISMIRDS